jgi:hypothetical protein
MFPRMWGRAVFSSLRFRLLLLVGLAILPALVLVAYAGLEQRQMAAAQVQANAMRLARLAANDRNRLIADACQLMTWLDQWAANAQLPAGSTLTVIDGDGTILARHPESERWVGRPVPEAPIIEVILSQQAEGTTEAIGVDHIRRLYAFTPIPVSVVRTCRCGSSSMCRTHGGESRLPAVVCRAHRRWPLVSLTFSGSWRSR